MKDENGLQQGAVQDHEGFPHGLHRLGQGRRGGGQDRDADAEPRGEPRGQVAQGAAGQIGRRGVGKQAKLLADTGDLG
ncbi:hypothetical protein [Streptomyces sp. NPDC050704]|uniref:hypothetical protein n=1 Tax=Streptomyces sp. NPDC050704 TaxID=3157219 RepID=UPI00342C0DFC